MEKSIRAWVEEQLAQKDQRVVLSGHVKDLEKTEDGIRLLLNKLNGNHLPVGETSAYADVSFAYVQEGSRSDETAGGSAGAGAASASRLMPGDYVLLSGTPALYETAGNPGGVSTRAQYAAKGIYFHIRKAKILQVRKHRDLTGDLTRLRTWLKQSFARVFPPDMAGVLQAMILGETRELSEDVRSLYQEGGISHILAISGLHMSLVGLGIYQLLRKRTGYRAAAVLSAAVLILYTLMTGMRLSAVRAMIMFLLWLLAKTLGRKADLPTCAAVAAAILIGRRPQVLLASSFYLSFGCVLSLFLLTPFFESVLPLPVRLKKVFAPQAAVTAGTLPLTCFFFFQITPYASLVNLAVIPCTGAVFLLSLPAALAGCVSTAAGRILSLPCRVLLTMFAMLCRAQSMLPGGVLITGQPKIWQVTGYYLLLAAAFLEWHTKRRKKREPVWAGKNTLPSSPQKTAVLKVLLPAVMILVLFLPVRPKISIMFLDIGQGDTILIRSGSHAALVDCGSSSVDQVWTRRISPCLKACGIRQLDLVFLTHSDEDHICGMEQMLAAYRRNLAGRNAADVSVGMLVFAKASLEEDPKLQRLAALARESKIESAGMLPGSRISMGKDLTLTCLYPDEEDVQATAGDPNQGSLVLWLEAPGLKMLLTGDLEKEGEERLVRKLPFLPGADVLTKKDGTERIVLKAGHHGSAAATSEELLTLLQPDLAVISCGRNNRYGHPAQRMLSRLHEHHVSWIRTDRSGAVTISLTGLFRKRRWKVGLFSGPG